MDTLLSQEFCDAVNASSKAQQLIATFEAVNKESLSRADLAILETIYALNKQAFDLLFKVGRI